MLLQSYILQDFFTAFQEIIVCSPQLLGVMSDKCTFLQAKLSLKTSNCNWHNKIQVNPIVFVWVLPGQMKKQLNFDKDIGPMLDTNSF